MITMKTPLRLGRLTASCLLVFTLLGGGNALAEKTILLAPGGQDGLMGTMAEVIQPGLQRALERPFEVATVIGERGGLAQDLTGRLPPDGSSLLVAELLTRAIDEALPDSDQETTLDALTPILKLAQGISVALVVPEGSPIGSYQELVEAAKERTLTIATSGKRSSSGVALALLAKRHNLPFTYSSRETVTELFRDLDSGSTDAAIVFTRVLAFPEFKGGYRALATFGADRSQLLRRSVPTLSELSGERTDAFTTSVALFGPPAMDPEVVARIEAAFFRGVSSDPKVLEVAVATGLDIVLKDADVVEETMARDQNVVKRVLPLLK
ncbi:MAG: tripartite tricarboxylate transporter substrate binding protein [Rhodospirillales bacterium]